MNYDKYEGHTKGPWYGGDDNKSLGIDGTYIYEFNRDTTHKIGRALPVRYATNKSRQERLINAQLMADAPLILQHCKELEGVREAAEALINDIRERYPNEDLYCPHMIALDNALREVREVNDE